MPSLKPSTSTDPVRRSHSPSPLPSNEGLSIPPKKPSCRHSYCKRKTALDSFLAKNGEPSTPPAVLDPVVVSDSKPIFVEDPLPVVIDEVEAKEDVEIASERGRAPSAERSSCRQMRRKIPYNERRL